MKETHPFFVHKVCDERGVFITRISSTYVACSYLSTGRPKSPHYSIFFKFISFANPSSLPSQGTANRQRVFVLLFCLPFHEKPMALPAGVSSTSTATRDHSSFFSSTAATQAKSRGLGRTTMMTHVPAFLKTLYLFGKSDIPAAALPSVFSYAAYFFFFFFFGPVDGRESRWLSQSCLPDHREACSCSRKRSFGISCIC